MYETPAKRFDWDPIVRYGGAFGGLAIIGYFVYQLIVAKHLDRTFKFGAAAAIVAIGIAGAIAILQRSEDDVPPGRRLYTADEVADLLNAVRAGRLPVPEHARGPATCPFCGETGAETRGLDGASYHRACFQAAYRAREEESRRRR